MNIQGNQILITGGSRGIGLEMAKQLELLGNIVIVTGRSEQSLLEVAAKIPGIRTIKCDMSIPAEIDALTQTIQERYPELNMLVNNAGIMKQILVAANDTSLSEMTEEIRINLSGPIKLTTALLPLLRKNENSAVVNVSSGVAFVPIPATPVYSATKAGLHAYTQSLRIQLSKTNTKVFELMPPATQTSLLDIFDSEAMQGAKVMSVQDLVKKFIVGLQNDTFEIRPGQANQMRIMSRFFPNFSLRQMSGGFV